MTKIFCSRPKFFVHDRNSPIASRRDGRRSERAIFDKLIGMIERIHNLWNALKFALGSERNAHIELDEASQKTLDQLLKGLRDAGNEVDQNEIARWHERVGISQQTRKLIADPEISIEEIARRELKCEWRRQLCENRKSIRSKFYWSPLIAIIPIVFWEWEARTLSGLATIFFVGWLLMLWIKLDSSCPNAEEEDGRKRSLEAQRAGDSQKAAEIRMEYLGKLIAKFDHNRGEQIERLIEESHHEFRK